MPNTLFQPLNIGSPWETAFDSGTLLVSLLPEDVGPGQLQTLLLKRLPDQEMLVETLQDWTETDLFFQTIQYCLTVLSPVDWVLYRLYQKVG